MKLFGSKYKASYTEKEILNQLDKCAEDFTFPMLDNGYVYPVESRMTVYRDDARWAIIIEVVGFNYRGGGHNGITNCLHVFGNCLNFEPGTNDNNFIYFTEDSDEGASFDSKYLEYMNPNSKFVLLRGRKIPIILNLEHYEGLGIELEQSPKIMIWEYLRGIAPKFRTDMLATDDELQDRIPQNLTRFLSLDEWRHIDLADGEKPSQSKTFKILAKTICTGRVIDYNPNVEPNNHWSNWQDGGKL